ncbi:hypothetical protein [Tenacibaculum halocynthiae]|uniref:hypothetical protein n=1 Tax=Tenacibaculum halocynthiae TaxID=1254437 RepID=UPI003D645AFB
MILHIVISSITAYIFLKKTPFTIWFKIAFLLSYFILYEYTVISRNYNLGVLLWFLPFILLKKSRIILIYEYTTSIGFVLFAAIIQRHRIRYNGILFFAIITSLWIMYYQQPKILSFKFHKLKTPIISSLIIVQVFSGILIYYLDIKSTFNNGENVVLYIKTNQLNSTAIATTYESASINTYLSNNLYYQTLQGYYLWNKEYFISYNKTNEELIQLGFEKNQLKNICMLL